MRLRLVRGSNIRGPECYSSCYQAKQHRPDLPSGVYCITVGGDETKKFDLYCDMVTMGGGFTFVARGSNSLSGCDTNAFGTASADFTLNSRWSLGDKAINEIGFDLGTQWIECVVRPSALRLLARSKAPHGTHARTRARARGA